MFPLRLKNLSSNFATHYASRKRRILFYLFLTCSSMLVFGILVEEKD